MRKALYSEFQGLDTSGDPLDQSQLSFLECDNYYVNFLTNTLTKRGGTENFSVTGDIWGIGGYAKNTASSKSPILNVPVQHRRDGSTSYIEKYDWASSWSAITQGSATSFAIGDIFDFAQIGDVFLLCAGRPAQITDIDSGNINRLGGPAPTAAPTVASSGTGLTGTFYYVYTFYDSTTGWESSPSPISAEITVSNKQIDLSALETTVTKEGVDKKRIYRTISTGEAPYLRVAEITLATTTYADTTADASLGTTAPTIADHEPPPDPAYVCAAHEGRFWIAKDNDIYYSHGYNGTNVNLEYFSELRKFTYPHRVTALQPARDGSLLVFMPPGYGIEHIVGRTPTEFESRPLWPGEGTDFHASVTVKDDRVAYWGATGPRIATPGGLVENYDNAVRQDIREALLGEYNTNVFCWSFWHADFKQFVWGVSLEDSSATMWVESGTSIVANWVDSVTGNAATWIDS